MDDSKSPVTGMAHKHTTGRGTSNQDWWPNQLNIGLLHQHSSAANPLGADFDYAQAFAGLLAEVGKAADLAARIPAKLLRIIKPEGRPGGRIEMPIDDLANVGVERHGSGIDDIRGGRRRRMTHGS